MPTPKKKITSQAVESHASKDVSKTILVAVTGLSPAVLMETVWALSQSKPQPVIPDKIIVLTTLTGQAKIKEQLFGPDNLWLTMRAQILGKNHATDPRLDFADTADRLKVFTRRSAGKRIPLDRMDTLEETEAVGDCLVEELWNWIGRPDTRVLASISGGFKTMSALLYAAMTVLGGPLDRILHVLVEEPFDGGTQPLFFWPQQPEQKLKTTRPSKVGLAGTTVIATSARPLLTDVQFPPLRKLFGDYGFQEPPSFSELVTKSRDAVSSIAPPAVESLLLRRESLMAEVNGLPLDVSKAQFYMLLFLAECTLEKTRFDCADDCHTSYREFLIHEHATAPQAQRAFLKDRRDAVTNDDGSRMTKTLSALRKALENKGTTGKALALHLPKSKHALTLPPELVTVEG